MTIKERLKQDFKTIESKSGLIYKRVDNSSRSFITERIKDKIFLYGDEDYNINAVSSPTTTSMYKSLKTKSSPSRRTFNFFSYGSV